MRLEDFGVSHQPVELQYDAALDADGVFGSLAPDSLFTALDGRVVRCAGDSWRIVVFSVSEGAGHRWIQLAVRGTADYALSLRLNGDEGAEQVVRLVKGWLMNGAENRNVIRATAALGESIDDAAPRAGRGIVRIGHHSAAQPRTAAGGSLPN